MNSISARFFRRDKVQQAARLLAASERPVILTGAGMSVGSGVPPFRGEGGIWSTSEYAAYAFPEALASDPDGSWEAYEKARSLVESCEPNAGHQAITRLLKRKSGARLFTQNVDGLHGRSAVELHGSLRRYRCMNGCSLVRDLPYGSKIASKDAVCPACDSRVRHDVVLFGEDLPHADPFRAALLDCDLVLFVGTSGLVTPTAQIAQIMQMRGTPVIDVNIDALTISRLTVDVYICAKAEVALPRMIDGV